MSLEKTAQEVHAEVGVKCSEVDATKDEVSYCKYRNELLGGELENKKK